MLEQLNQIEKSINEIRILRSQFICTQLNCQLSIHAFPLPIDNQSRYNHLQSQFKKKYLFHWSVFAFFSFHKHPVLYNNTHSKTSS